MRNGDTVYLRHIADALSTIEEYVDGLSYDEFRMSKMVIDAVVRELEIIGEAASKLSQKFAEAHPELPIQLMVGMRNRLIHEYFGVKIDVVWDTCQHDLPRLREVVLLLIG